MSGQADHQMRKHVDLTVEIIAAYVSNNNVPITELAAALAGVHAALVGLANGTATEPTGPEKPTPAQIRKSITPDALISFEDGKSYKALKRHLVLRGLTASDYRLKYGLSADYPMTAPNYSAQRSALARSLGLGHRRRKPQLEVVPAPSGIPGTESKMPESGRQPPTAAEAPRIVPRARGRRTASETA